LRENFRDYEVLYRRANDLYHHEEYLKALDDLDRAIKYCPPTDTEMLFPIYALRSATYWQLKRYTQALPDINKAIEIDPTSSSALNMRAELNLELGNLTDAKADFERLRRMNPRSTEALFGLAKVAALEKNIGMANEYCEMAISRTPTQSAVFVSRAEVKQLMGDYNGAVDDLLLAMATDSSDPYALPKLVEMANGNYAAVMTGLSSAIRTAPRTPLYYFLRGSIAVAHYHYSTAIDDFRYIIDNNLYNYAGLYTLLAECHYALGDYQAALDEVETALTKYDEEDDVAHYYVVRSQILRAMGEYDRALSSAERALEFAPDRSECLMASSLALVSLKRYDEAQAQIGEVVMNDPFAPMPYFYRAWVLNDFSNKAKAAKALYDRVIDLELDHSERIGSMLGFARLFAGQTPQAIAWIEGCLEEPDYDGRTHYLGACFYAWAGRNDRALECMEQALKLGYANYHQW
ncbi:MAG: tetratricopeptide repeat protein, partial [Muribaculaceae bacterium]|nr:tetratricopeptide repeat protein [Muribaculaceae bacterium]